MQAYDAGSYSQVSWQSQIAATEHRTSCVPQQSSLLPEAELRVGPSILLLPSDGTCGASVRLAGGSACAHPQGQLLPGSWR